MPTGLGSRPTFSCSRPRGSRYISFAGRGRVLGSFGALQNKPGKAAKEAPRRTRARATPNDLSGNLFFDFRTSTLSIGRTALLGKVLVDFVPHGSQECGENEFQSTRKALRC